MIRLLIFILSAVFFAAAGTILLSLGQRVHVEAFGWKLDAPAGVAGANIAIVVGAFGLLVSLYKDVMGMRRRRVLRGVLKRREKGIDSLLEAAAAHAGAEYAKAEKLAQKASRLLDRDGVNALFAPPSATAAPAAIDIESAPDLGAPVPAEIPLEQPVAPMPAALPAPAEAPDRLAEEALDRDAAAARRVS